MASWSTFSPVRKKPSKYGSRTMNTSPFKFTRHGSACKEIISQAEEVITGMSEEQKKLIDETVDNLKHLNKESLLIVKSGTEMLKARDAMDREQEAEKEVS